MKEVLSTAHNLKQDDFRRFVTKNARPDRLYQNENSRKVKYFVKIYGELYSVRPVYDYARLLNSSKGKKNPTRAPDGSPEKKNTKARILLDSGAIVCDRENCKEPENPIEPLNGNERTVVLAGSPEGRRVWRLQRFIERSKACRNEAKALNKETNQGQLKCEACGISDSTDSLFDVHHPYPLAAGVRKTTANDLKVLCPLCHRIAHRKAADPLSPLPVEAIRRVIEGLRVG